MYMDSQKYKVSPPKFGSMEPENDAFLGGGNSNMFLFSPRKLGKKLPNLTIAYFSKGVGDKPTNQFWKTGVSSFFQGLHL